MAPLLSRYGRHQTNIRPAHEPSTPVLQGTTRRPASSSPRYENRICKAGPTVLRSRSRCAITPQAVLCAPQRTARSGVASGPRSKFSHVYGGQPYIHGAVMRRGRRVIISAVLADVEGQTDIRSMLQANLDGDTRLVKGTLSNGLRYVIYPNKLPPQRFEAHLEMHVGSVDELPNEQGMAHLVEHVTFLGSSKREALLGTGARANAYTDFHHTVFHVHAPLVNNITKEPMLKQVLDALNEIAFNPQFAGTRIEKERKAVTAEAQMMNTIEYRVDCQLLQHLHYENNLGVRFPIGKMDQVQAWSHEQLKEFWSKWYFPANATLYVVGDLDRDIEATQALIQKVFGNVRAATMTKEDAEKLAALSAKAGDGHQPPAFKEMKVPVEDGKAGATAKNGNGSKAAKSGTDSDEAVAKITEEQVALFKQRHTVRPPVEHEWGYGPLPADYKPARINTFRHPLLQSYMLSVFCKLPIVPMNTFDGLKRMFLMRIIVSVFQFRINKRYVAADPPFQGISLDISDSGREGCCVCTLTVTSEPQHWRGATAVAVQEMRRLQRHGLTPGELERYTTAILRDSAQLAEQGDRVPSLDTLNFVMENLACGHTIMDHRSSHDAMLAVASSFTLEDANALARSMLTFGSDFGHEAGALAAADAAPEDYTYLGPTRSTSVLVCIPAYVSDTGAAVTVGGGAAGRAGASMGAAGHIDVDAVDLAAIEEQSRQAAALEEQVPEGAISFTIDNNELIHVLGDMSYPVEAPLDVQCPEHVLDPVKLESKLKAFTPEFVALDDKPEAGVRPPADPFSGVHQRKMNNGMKLNFKHSDNEPQGGLMRIIVPGGKGSEKMEAGVDGFGAVCLGPQVINESGRVGEFTREQIEVYQITNQVQMMMDSDEENIIIDMHYSTSHGSLEAAFELMHMLLTEPTWSEEAFKRAKTQFQNARAVSDKSLEKASQEKIMDAMFGGPATRRFRLPTDEELDALTLEGVRRTLEGLMHPGAIEVNIVGDIDCEAVEGLALTYLGSIPPRDPSLVRPIVHVTQGFQDPSFEERHFAWHLQDSDERGVAYIAGQAPARWGTPGNYDPLPPLLDFAPPPPPVRAYPNPAARQAATDIRRAHPLYTSCLLMLLTEIINSRLFTTVRDSMGLTYDVSFEVTYLDRVRAGWWNIHVTADPSKIYDAMDASVGVIRDVDGSTITRRELDRAKTTILTRHDSDMKDNAYVLGLLTHTQNPHVPWKSIKCLKDLIPMFEAITIEDIYDCFQHIKLDDQSLFTCIGTSGKSAPSPPEERLVNGIGSSRYAESDWASRQAANGQALPMNPVAMFTAMLAAAQSMNLKKALDTGKTEEQTKPGPEKQ